jgi:hypothetical protein
MRGEDDGNEGYWVNADQYRESAITKLKDQYCTGDRER